MRLVVPFQPVIPVNNCCPDWVAQTLCTYVKIGPLLAFSSHFIQSGSADGRMSKHPDRHIQIVSKKNDKIEWPFCSITVLVICGSRAPVK